MDQARNLTIPGETPWVETSRKMIEHHLRGRMNGFDRVLYFIYGGVKVCQTGTKAEAIRRENLTSEEKAHQGKS